MAKHICMIQRSQKGMQYRQYFLEIERAWNSPEKVMARALQIAKKQIEELQTRCFCLSVENRRQEGLIREIKPKAEYADKVLQSKSLLLTTQIAKDYGMSAVKFNRLLYDLGIHTGSEVSGCFMQNIRTRDIQRARLLLSRSRTGLSIQNSRRNGRKKAGGFCI
jgi:hypothetical protein